METRAKKKAPETTFRKPFSVVVTRESHFPESQSRPLGRERRFGERISIA
jgi:hypothetical protein